MKTWNHRVIETQQDGQINLTIHEVHYADGGAPLEHNAPTIVDGESLDDLRALLASMTAALSLPILAADAFLRDQAPGLEILALKVCDLMAA